MTKSSKNSNKKKSTPASRSRPATADCRQYQGGARVYKVGAFDVLMGRGGNINKNRGNVFFRSVVGKHRYEYQHQTKAGKPRLIAHVIAAVQQAGGQFLVESGRNEDNKAYYSTASLRDIRKKTAQALREKTTVRPFSEEPTKKDSPVLVKLKIPLRPAIDKKDPPSYKKLDPPPLQKHRVARRFTRSALRLSSDGPVTPSSSTLMTNNKEAVRSAFYRPLRAITMTSKRASMDDTIDDGSSQKRHRLLDSPNDMTQDMKELLSMPLVISPIEMVETPSPPHKTSSQGPAAGAIMVSTEHNQVPCLERRGEPSPPNGFPARIPPGRIMVQRKRILLPSSPAPSSSDRPPRVNGEHPISPPPIITPRVLPMQARGVLESVPEECAVNNVGNDTSPDLSRMLAEYESMSGGKKNHPHHTSPTSSETSLFSLQTTTPSPTDNSISLDGLPVVGAQLAPHRSVRLVSEMIATSLLEGKMVEEAAPSSSASKLLLQQDRLSFEVGFLPIHPQTETLAGSPTPPIKAMHNLSLREGSPAPMAMFASRSPSEYGSNPSGEMAVLPHLEYLSTPTNMQVSPNHHPLHQLSSIHSQATGYSHTEWKISPLIPFGPSSFGKDRQHNDSSIDRPHKKAKTSKILKFNDDDPNSPLDSQRQKIDNQIIMYKTPERNHPACVEIRTRRISDVTGQAAQPTCSEDAPAARPPVETDVNDGTRASSSRRVSL